MKRDFNVIIEKDEEGFYVASVPSLRGCHTQAKSLDVLMERIKEAIELCLEEESATIYPYDFVGVQKITINEPVVNYVTSISKGSKSIKKNKRTVHQTTSKAKLSVIRDKKGSFIDVKTYKLTHSTEVAKKNRKRNRK